MNDVKVGFSYGAFAKPLEEQANAQGYTLGDKKEFLQRLNDSYHTIRIGLGLPQSVSENICKRLHKKVIENLSKVEE